MNNLSLFIYGDTKLSASSFPVFASAKDYPNARCTQQFCTRGFDAEETVFKTECGVCSQESPLKGLNIRHLNCALKTLKTGRTIGSENLLGLFTCGEGLHEPIAENLAVLVENSYDLENEINHRIQAPNDLSSSVHALTSSVVKTASQWFQKGRHLMNQSLHSPQHSGKSSVGDAFRSQSLGNLGRKLFNYEPAGDREDLRHIDVQSDVLSQFSEWRKVDVQPRLNQRGLRRAQSHESALSSGAQDNLSHIDVQSEVLSQFSGWGKVNVRSGANQGALRRVQSLESVFSQFEHLSMDELPQLHRGQRRSSPSAHAEVYSEVESANYVVTSLGKTHSEFESERKRQYDLAVKKGRSHGVTTKPVESTDLVGNVTFTVRWEKTESANSENEFGSVTSPPTISDKQSEKSVVTHSTFGTIDDGSSSGEYNVEKELASAIGVSHVGAASQPDATELSRLTQPESSINIDSRKNAPLENNKSIRDLLFSEIEAFKSRIEKPDLNSEELLALKADLTPLLHSIDEYQNSYKPDGFVGWYRDEFLMKLENRMLEN